MTCKAFIVSDWGLVHAIYICCLPAQRTRWQDPPIALWAVAVHALPTVRSVIERAELGDACMHLLRISAE